MYAELGLQHNRRTLASANQKEILYVAQFVHDRSDHACLDGSQHQGAAMGSRPPTRVRERVNLSGLQAGLRGLLQAAPGAAGQRKAQADLPLRKRGRGDGPRGHRGLQTFQALGMADGAPDVPKWQTRYGSHREDPGDDPGGRQATLDENGRAKSVASEVRRRAIAGAASSHMEVSRAE